MDHDAIIILDYGSQYTPLIARQVRKLNFYCEIFSWRATAEEVMALNPKGFVLSGGPSSVYAQDSPSLPDYVLASGRPILGICYGMQLLAHHLAGQVVGSDRREYGPARLIVDAPDDVLFQGWQSEGGQFSGDDAAHSPTFGLQQVWMSHADTVDVLPPGFRPLAHTEDGAYAVAADTTLGYYAIQFHPEVSHTPQGHKILRNFIGDICGCEADWTPANFIAEQVAALREQIGDGRVVLGLSGGVDSAVTAELVHRAVGEQLTCIFVDHGLLRQGEAGRVIRAFGQERGMELVLIDAEEELLEALAGVTDPEQKRRIIGEKFVRLFERAAAGMGGPTRPIDFLAQGTIYPDVIESAGGDRPEAETIKTHHNVGGLPEDMRFELVEPLRSLFKDEVRRVGAELGLPEPIVWQQPFPGPGLAIRCLGEVTRERLERLRAADAIFIDELERADLLKKGAYQAFAVLLPVKSVGVMGDGRTYQEVIALRAVTTEDFMTADWARLPADLLARASRRIVNNVSGVNRVVYDITTKPPGTIEWE
jgi:GMP synthase (glutamine-hydrolysing)